MGDRDKIQENICCLEAHTVDDTHLRDNELVFLKVDTNDYIIKPRAMLYWGSMCVTELYSK